MTVPTKIAGRLPLLQAFHYPLHFKGEPRFKVVQFKQNNRNFLGSCIKQMPSTLESHDGSFETTTRLVCPAIEEYVAEAIKDVNSGEVIAVPTDTLYGFACDACSVDAVNRIYKIKGRKLTSPLAICVGDVSDIVRFAVTDHLPADLLYSLLPGPVTIVLRRGDSSILEKSLNPGLDSIGVRIPDGEFIRAVCRGSRTALALTSANLSGQPSSICIKDFHHLWEHCAHVYDGGVLPMGRAGSTIVDLTVIGRYKILRPGSALEETVAILKRYSLQDAAVVG